MDPKVGLEVAFFCSMKKPRGCIYVFIDIHNDDIYISINI